MSSTTYLITGANRGIGLGLVETFIMRDNATVVAAVRDASKSAKALEALQGGKGSKVIVVEIDSSDHSTPHKAVEALKTKHGIDRLDTVIANAGISTSFKPLAETPLEVVQEHFNVNALAPLALFQAVRPLLVKSSNPKFVAISTGVASVAMIPKYPVPFGGYGQSKASLNYIAAKLAAENPEITIFPMSPGWLQTEGGNTGAQNAGLGMTGAPTTVEEGVKGVVSQIDKATLKDTSGQFVDFDSDERIPW